jgi:hypothetical protein
VFDFQAAIDQRQSIGGTGSTAVRHQLKQAQDYLAQSAGNKGDHHEW